MVFYNFLFLKLMPFEKLNSSKKLDLSGNSSSYSIV